MKCSSRKIGYSSYANAEFAITGLADRHNARYRVYRCHICNQWHLTTKVEPFTPPSPATPPVIPPSSS